MKQNQIKDLPTLSHELYENIFNVYEEENGLYYYNLLQTVVFPKNLPANFFVSYDISYGDTWPNISFKVYNTPNLWWLILLANEINNPLEQPIPGKTLFVPTIEVAKNILSEIRK